MLNPQPPIDVEEAGQIFISHATANRDWAEWVAAQSIAVGVRPYLAESHNAPGEYHAQEIRGAIRASAAVLVLMTEAAYDSRYVSQEIGAAIQEGRLVVALVDPRLRGRDLAMLEGIQYLPFDYADPLPSIPALSATLRKFASVTASGTGSGSNQAQTGTVFTFAGSASLQINLTPSQALVGVAVMALIVGAIIVSAQSGGGPGPTA